MNLSALPLWPLAALVAYLGAIVGFTWLLHRRIKAAEERSILVGKRVAAIRKNLGEIRDSYGDGTTKLPDLEAHLELLEETTVQTREQLGELANRVRILPAQMARAARGERYDKDEDEDDEADADEITPDDVAELIRQRANGNLAPSVSPSKSIERQVFEMIHGRGR